MDAVNGDYHLTDTSPCIGAGTSDAVSDTDMDGNPRVTPPDMGAYENSRDMPLPKIIHVNATTGDDANGDGVSTPYRTIQKGIDEANDVDTVVVANGTYTGPGNVDIDFFGKPITVKSANGPESCIIDCGGSGRGFYFHSGETGISVLNGFTITNGFAEYGAGICCMSSSPRILNIIIAGNTASQSGGGIHCHFSTATIEDTIITENNASEYGGGIHCYSSNPTVINATIAANISNCGGGLACHTRSSPTIINTTITGNNAISEGGGGISCLGFSSPTITNATITGNNTSRDGGGIYCDISSSPIITNTILWGDTPGEIYGDGLPISYSDIQGGFSGKGNMDMDPLFVDAANDNYRLRDDSPCIGAGTREDAPAEDIEGNPRKTPPDMGAYESVQPR